MWVCRSATYPPSPSPMSPCFWVGQQGFSCRVCSTFPQLLTNHPLSLFLKINLRERERSACYSTHLCIHWSIPARALAGVKATTLAHLDNMPTNWAMARALPILTSEIWHPVPYLSLCPKNVLYTQCCFIVFGIFMELSCLCEFLMCIF